MEFNTQGEIQNIRKDGKAIAILGNWYNSFKEIKDLKKGDEITLIYNENKKDNKVFKNIKSYKLIEKVKQIESNKEIVISDTGKNCILMQSVIIYLDRKDLTLSEIVKTVTEAYKLI